VDERMVLYEHDTMGLGHLRRNLALAAALRESPRRPQVLVVTGTTEACRFPLPDGVELMVLPGVAKAVDGSYRSRRLDVPLVDILAIRCQALTAAIASYRPDLLVVDKVARGFAGELEAVLPLVREAGTRIVLGLRDILDAPAAATAEWRQLRTSEALRAWYDEVWVYGDPQVSDLAADCRIPPSVRHLLRFTGFLAEGRPTTPIEPPVAGSYALCLLGGGQDGAELATAFVATPRPAGVAGVLVTGPHLPEQARAALRAAADPGMRVVDFCADPISWVSGAAAVVCMGGYNTVAEVLTTTTPALVVPRVAPRAEQLVRARRLSERGLVDDVHPDDLSPDVLGGWLADAVCTRQPRTGVALDGLARVRALADAHLKEARHAA
jgi:predicted glycosyltransferase